MLVGICGDAGAGKDTAAQYLVTKHYFHKIAFADPLKRFLHDVFGIDYDHLWGPSVRRGELFLGFSMEVAAERMGKFGGPWLVEVLDGEVTPRHGSSLEDWFHDMTNVESLTPRELLQTLGTEWGRAHTREDVWVRYLLRQVDKITSGTHYYIDNKGCVELPEGYTDGSNASVVISDVRFGDEAQGVQGYTGGRLVMVNKEDTQDVGIPGHASEDGIDCGACDVILNNDGTKQELFDALDIVVNAGGE